MSTHAKSAAAAPTVKKGWIPTKKWVVAQIAALAGLAYLVVDGSGWTESATKLLIGIVVQAATTYLIPNAPTPGGAPDAELRGRSSWSTQRKNA